jgi:16S rRNA G966 N2-methylase RsmD
MENKLIDPKKIIKNKLFPIPLHIDKSDEEINKFFDKLLIDDDSVSYISTPEDSSLITKIIRQHCVLIGSNPMGMTITDATAGVGGNVISFATDFGNVNAIEIDSYRYKCLVNNIESYKFLNITTYCDNSLKIIHEVSKQNIVFIDPPWGGKNYKNNNNIKLKLGNISIEQICIKLFDEGVTNSPPEIICVKLPKNYNLIYLYNEINKSKNLKIFCYDLNKMFIIIIHK